MVDPQSNNIVQTDGFAGNILTSQSILDVFVLQDILDMEDADKLRKNFKTNREIEDYLVRNRLVTLETINKAYSILLKLPYVSLENVDLPDEALRLIPEKLASRYGIIPFNVKERLIRLAVSRPADLLTRYPESLAKYFQENNLAIELFITGDKDFNEAVKQYDKKKKKTLLLKKGSLPVVYLRNQIVPDRYLKKFPKDFIEKYHLAVFGQNDLGDYLVACEQTDSPLTRKIVDFIEKENGVKVELFATSLEDIKFLINQYDRPTNDKPKLDIGFRKEKREERTDERKDQDKISLRGMFSSFMGDSQPEFTIDDYPRLGNFEEASTKGEDQVKQEELSEKQEEAQQPVGTAPVEQNEVSQKKELNQETKQEVKQEVKQDLPPKLVEAEKTTASIELQPVIADAVPESDLIAKKSGAGEGLEGKDLGSFLGGKNMTSDSDLAEIIKEGYIPKIVAGLVGLSLTYRASDIHIEPGTKYLRVRCRVDGILRDVAKIPLNLHPPIVSRIKILSRLKIDETRVPQDGRFDVVFNRRNVDVRVSVLPTVHGEKIVLRILDKDQSLLSLEDLGMRGSAFDLTVKAVNKPYGIILSTGPTGSGKSTTLYAIINRLSLPGVNIVTLEDPVEYEIAGVNQCQVKPEIGFTFASGLRSVLRQDPNVIMVGEIRDAETAGMATHSALTGHLVLSTLHTNDAAGALPRLTNMGIEPFLITSSINLVIAQRLVRKICVKCREEMKVPPKLYEEIKAELAKITSKDPQDLSRVPQEIRLFYGKGCSECSNGFRGRAGLFEVMEINDEIEDMAVEKRPANEIKDAAIRNGMITMKQDGILKALDGITTIDEVLQATTNS